MTDTKFAEDMITLTAYPEWHELVKDLKNTIYHVQSNALEAKSWDKLCEERGFARGLAYMVNLREDMKKYKDLADAEV